VKSEKILRNHLSRKEHRMKNILRRNFRGKNIVFFFFLLIMGFFLSSSYGEENSKDRFGISILGGINSDNKPHMRTVAFIPRFTFPLKGNWNFEFEGDFSYYGILGEKNIYFLGVDGNIIFKPILWKGGNIFLLAGAGLGYDNSNGKIKELGDSHLCGLLQCGSGVNIYIGKGLWLRGEYRFQHISEPFRRDSGLNSHNILLGLSF